EAWVRHHVDELRELGEPDASDDAIVRIAQEFVRIGGGHPLHLRYSFRALRERGVRIDEYSIRNLPPCPTDDITDYYEALISSVSEGGQFVLHLFASSRFSWPRSGLLDCLERA